MNNLDSVGEWKTLTKCDQSFKERFKISPLGSIRAIDQESEYSFKLSKLKFKTPRYVELRKQDVKLKYKLAELVALTFLPDCPGEIQSVPGGWVVDFKDENRCNSAASNLYWLPFELWRKKNMCAIRKERYTVLPGSRYSINARICPNICSQIKNEKDLSLEELSAKYDLDDLFVESIRSGGWVPKYVPKEKCSIYGRSAAVAKTEAQVSMYKSKY